MKPDQIADEDLSLITAVGALLACFCFVGALALPFILF